MKKKLEKQNTMVSAVQVFLCFFSTLLSSSLQSATVVDDLVNLKPPPDFNTTIANNCRLNPSLRYCNLTFSVSDLTEIFRSTIVASHLCKESKNPNCVETFPLIDLANKPKIAPLYLSFGFFWKYCPLTILTINVTNSSLKGDFPNDVLLCTQVQVLDFSRNKLSGDFPVEGFSRLTNLTVLNLSYNGFSEIKESDKRVFEKFNSSSFIKSGLIPNKHHYRIKAVVLLVGFPVIITLVICFLGSLCFRNSGFGIFRRKHGFTHRMLEDATDGFARRNLVERNQESESYRGTLKDGREVKIEIFKESYNDDNFSEECDIFVELQHTNLVRVLGWCSDRRSNAFVTEWCNGENMERWLVRSGPTWKQRLKVVIGVMEGMRYLEQEWPQVGFDLRTKNLWVCENQQPLITKFTLGTHDSKIYKFGLFLLEIITNLRRNEELEGADSGYIQYISVHCPGNIQSVVDERMELSEDTFEQAKQGLRLGLMCLDESRATQSSLDYIFHKFTGFYESLNQRAHADGTRRHKNRS